MFSRAEKPPTFRHVAHTKEVMAMNVTVHEKEAIQPPPKKTKRIKILTEEDLQKLDVDKLFDIDEEVSSRLAKVRAEIESNENRQYGIGRFERGGGAASLHRYNLISEESPFTKERNRLTEYSQLVVAVLRQKIVKNK